MLVIDIDYREQKILKLIDPTITNISVSDTIYGPVTHGSKVVFYYKISNLIIGDFIYRNSQVTNETTQVTNEISQETNETSDVSSVYCIIERKKSC